jgi:DNA-binding PadR family transcriptional regulator
MSGLNFEFMQNRTAREHRDNILLALQVSKNATSGKIKRWIDDKVEREIKQQYDKKTRYGIVDKDQLSADMHKELQRKRMSQGTIQKWLAKLKKQGLVKDDEYNVYSLTVVGKKLTIFSRLYGEILFYELVEKPSFTGSDRDRINECIKRFGAYILYVFIYNLTIKDHSLTKKDFLDNFLSWPEETISPSHIFKWFFYIFLHDELENHDNMESIVKILEEQNTQYFKAFERSNIRFTKAQKGERF